MLWHGINLGVKFFLNFHHVLLVMLGNQIDCKTNLSISSTTTDSVQISASFSREVKVDNNIDSWYIDTSCDQVWADQCFKLAFSEAFENFGSFLSLHSWMKITILIFSLVKFLGQELSSFVGTAEDNALIDNELWINFVNGFHFILFVKKHVIMGEPNQH